MKIILQQLPSSLRGPARMKFLAMDAAASLASVEKETGGLIYQDIWRDPVACLLARRTRKGSQLPSYSGHGIGIAFDLSLNAVLTEKKIRYEDLLYMLKRRGWFCHRRDGDPSKPESEHFTFLGDMPEKYLTKTTLDPTTWQRPAEERIYERFGKEFILEPKQVQLKLSQIGLYTGPLTGTIDAYTREAILAFQRTWDLVEDGTMSYSLQRVLAFITADFEFVSPVNQREQMQGA